MHLQRTEREDERQTTSCLTLLNARKGLTDWLVAFDHPARPGKYLEVITARPLCYVRTDERTAQCSTEAQVDPAWMSEG